MKYAHYRSRTHRRRKYTWTNKHGGLTSPFEGYFRVDRGLWVVIRSICMYMELIPWKMAVELGVSLPFLCDICGSEHCVAAWVTEEGPEAGIHLLCMSCEGRDD